MVVAAGCRQDLWRLWPRRLLGRGTSESFGREITRAGAGEIGATHKRKFRGKQGPWWTRVVQTTDTLCTTVTGPKTLTDKPPLCDTQKKARTAAGEGGGGVWGRDTPCEAGSFNKVNEEARARKGSIPHAWWIKSGVPWLADESISHSPPVRGWPAGPAWPLWSMMQRWSRRPFPHQAGHWLTDTHTYTHSAGSARWHGLQATVKVSAG